jgi:hypothetical protein
MNPEPTRRFSAIKAGELWRDTRNTDKDWYIVRVKRKTNTGFKLEVLGIHREFVLGDNWEIPTTVEEVDVKLAELRHWRLLSCLRRQGTAALQRYYLLNR